MDKIGRLACKIGLHRWVTQRNPENAAPYLKCERCGKEKDTITLSDYMGG
jgi:hypothetical protein